MEVIQLLSIASPVLVAIGLYLTIRHRQDKKESENPFGQRLQLLRSLLMLFLYK